MSTWIMEPGHTEAEFRARHMMVTWVRGLFRDIHGTVERTIRGATRTVPLDVEAILLDDLERTGAVEHYR